MGIDQVLQERRNDILRVARAYGATRVRALARSREPKPGRSAISTCSSTWNPAAVCSM